MKKTREIILAILCFAVGILFATVRIAFFESGLNPWWLSLLLPILAILFAKAELGSGIKKIKKIPA